MIIPSIIFILSKFVFSLIVAQEYSTITTNSSEVCDLDNSCNASNILLEEETGKTNLLEKWKYNISDNVTSINDTAVNIYLSNEINNTINLEIDESSKNYHEFKPINETKSTNTKYQIQLDEPCFCDLDKGSCDLNCCCDRDCLNVNRDVFQLCNSTLKVGQDSSCASKILNSPLLCVIRDNLYSRHFYPKHKVLFDTLNVEKLLRNREVFSWSFPSLPVETYKDPDFPKELKEYKLGSPIWIVINGSKLKEFSLPKPTLISRDCGNIEPVGFLEDHATACTYQIQNDSKFSCEDSNSVFNAARYFENVSVIMNPNMTNLSIPFICSKNCAAIKLFVCETDDDDSCRLFNSTLKPSFENRICEKAVINVHYKIIHNGSEGIRSVELYVRVANLELIPNRLWSVPFSLTHEWLNQSVYYMLSGYPGYILGKPIITGYKNFGKNKFRNTKNIMEMNYNRKRWLTYFGAGMSNECLKMRRNNILFRENIYAHCSMQVPEIRTTEQCQNFQNEIFNVIFGVHTNLSNVYVSSTGEPDLTDDDKWIPFISDLSSIIVNESCSGIIASVKVFVLHALTGEFNDPQHSIVGVKIMGNSFNRSVQKRKQLKVSILVNFYDVTNPPIRIFAEPPTYEVKLPTDFFYPFFSTSSKLLTSKYWVLLLVAFLIRDF